MSEVIKAFYNEIEVGFILETCYKNGNKTPIAAVFKIDQTTKEPIPTYIAIDNLSFKDGKKNKTIKKVENFLKKQEKEEIKQKEKTKRK